MEGLIMRRREFITLLGCAAVAWPRSVTAGPPPGRLVMIGVIAPPSFPAVEGLRIGLRELGYIEGQNLRLEYRWTEGSADEYSRLALELVQRNADVIVTYGTRATVGARMATATVPIVTAAVGDPVVVGL